jgi:hypothetical protein
MFGKPNAAARPAQQAGQRRTAGFPWVRAHVLAIESEQVEGIEENCPGGPSAFNCSLKWRAK